MAKHNYWNPRPETQKKRIITREEWYAFKNDGIPLDAHKHVKRKDCKCGFGDCPICGRDDYES